MVIFIKLTDRLQVLPLEIITISWWSVTQWPFQMAIHLETLMIYNDHVWKMYEWSLMIMYLETLMIINVWKISTRLGWVHQHQPLKKISFFVSLGMIPKIWKKIELEYDGYYGHVIILTIIFLWFIILEKYDDQF